MYVNWCSPLLQGKINLQVMEVDQKREKRESPPLRILTCVFSVSNTLTILSLVTACQVK